MTWIATALVVMLFLAAVLFLWATVLTWKDDESEAEKIVRSHWDEDK